MTRARRAASARPRPDRTRASRSARWSVVSTSDVDGMRHHMIYNSLVQATSPRRMRLREREYTDPAEGLTWTKLLQPYVRAHARGVLMDGMSVGLSRSLGKNVSNPHGPPQARFVATLAAAANISSVLLHRRAATSLAPVSGWQAQPWRQVRCCH
jgi:hypothetical protein